MNTTVCMPVQDDFNKAPTRTHLRALDDAGARLLRVLPKLLRGTLDAVHHLRGALLRLLRTRHRRPPPRPPPAGHLCTCVAAAAEGQQSLAPPHPSACSSPCCTATQQAQPPAPPTLRRLARLLLARQPTSQAQRPPSAWPGLLYTHKTKSCKQVQWNAPALPALSAPRTWSRTL